MFAEDHQCPQSLGDLETALRFPEMAVSNACRQALEGGGRIDPPARDGDGFAVDVCREDTDCRPRHMLAKGFGDADGQGVGLFAGRATGRPDAELPLFAPGLGYQFGQDVVAQVLEELRVSEELRDLDEEAVDETGVLVRIRRQMGRIVGEGWARSGGHPATQPPQDRGRLV